MVALHTVLVYLHIAVGSVALVLFWVPAFAKKGGRLHVRVGRIYVQAMLIVSLTAFVAAAISLVDPIGVRQPTGSPDAAALAELAARYRAFSLFLLMLSILVFASVRHGILALEARRNPQRLKASTHRALLLTLGIVAVVVGSLGILQGHILLMIFAGISLSASVGMFRDTLGERLKGREFVIAHFNGLIGSGIGAYTAFFSFGGSRFLGEILSGQWQIVPWVLPAIIGTGAIIRLSRRYRGGVRN